MNKNEIISKKHIEEIEKIKNELLNNKFDSKMNFSIKCLEDYLFCYERHIKSYTTFENLNHYALNNYLTDSVNWLQKIKEGRG